MVDPLTSSSTNERTRIRRLPEKGVDDREVLEAILDAGVVAHVGIAVDPTGDSAPFVMPVAYARDGERLLLHGSRASRLFRALAAGTPTCVTVTHLDALVVARSAFESSMHYRSAMMFGQCTELTDGEQLAALRVLTDHLLPGRWDEVRAPHAKEVRATMVLALPLTEWSVKVSDGQPDDPDDDVAGTAWAGILPLHHGYGQPVRAENLRAGIDAPRSVTDLAGSSGS